MKLSRRQFLQSAVVTATVVGTGINAFGKEVLEVELRAGTINRTFLEGGATEVMGYNDGVPTIRIKQGQILKVHLINDLNEPTTIHWHGIRLPNKMDGVPLLTQPPVPSGGKFTYEFECTDAGSFWFHTHIGSRRQMGRGMIGLLIIEDETKQNFDVDVAWGYHDLSLKKDGTHRSDDMTTHMNRMGAAMGGSLGNVPLVNDVPVSQNIKEVPAGSVVRLRLLNTDNSRIIKAQLYSGEDVYDNVKVIALDGNALTQSFDLNRWRMGPANRLDLAIKMPDEVGAEIHLANVFARTPYVIGTLKTTAQKRTAVDVPFPPQPRLNPIPVPNLSKAEVLKFEFHNMAVSSVNAGDPDPIWGINNVAWSENNGTLPEPIQKLELGKPYIFRLKNISKFSHPIHIHGHTWWVLKSNKSTTRTGYHTDTVLLRSREEIDVAFVADNVGGWMYHCHIVDHMITGMMSWVQVGESKDIATALALTPEEVLKLGGLCG